MYFTAFILICLLATVELPSSLNKNVLCTYYASKPMTPDQRHMLVVVIHPVKISHHQSVKQPSGAFRKVSPSSPHLVGSLSASLLKCPRGRSRRRRKFNYYSLIIIVVVLKSWRHTRTTLALLSFEIFHRLRSSYTEISFCLPYITRRRTIQQQCCT